MISFVGLSDVSLAKIFIQTEFIKPNGFHILDNSQVKISIRTENPAIRFLLLYFNQS
jgi:hypothetical protein